MPDLATQLLIAAAVAVLIYHTAGWALLHRDADADGGDALDPIGTDRWRRDVPVTDLGGLVVLDVRTARDGNDYLLLGWPATDTAPALPILGVCAGNVFQIRLGDVSVATTDDDGGEA